MWDPIIHLHVGPKTQNTLANKQKQTLRYRKRIDEAGWDGVWGDG